MTPGPLQRPHLREVHICRFGALKRRSHDHLAGRITRIGTTAHVREDILEWEVGNVVFPCVRVELEDVRQGDTFNKKNNGLLLTTISQ